MPTDTVEDSLRQRLALVVRDHNQAKLARLTGRSRTALTRYMQGARIPLEFGTAVCAELGVSPAWLLSGQGAMYVADLPATSTALGHDLLELIRTMDAMAGVKLGTMADRPQARTLREVTQSLAQYGSIRDRLNARTRPVLSELLDQIEAALNARRYDRGAALAETAEKVARYTEDPELSRRLLRARAHILHVRQQTQQATEIELELFRAMLGRGDAFTIIADTAAQLALTLRSDGRSARARQVVRMARASAEGAESQGRAYAMLLAQEIMACVELGEMQGVSALVEHGVAAAPADDHAFMDMAKLFFYAHSGLLSPHDIVGASQPAFPAAAMVLGLAVWTEDAEMIEAALGPVRRLANPQMPLNQLHLAAGERALAAIQGKLAASELTRLYTRARENTGNWYALGDLSSIAQLLRLAGDPRARALVELSRMALELVPADRCQLPIAVARHVRNALAFEGGNRADREMREHGLALCRRRIAQGYGLLRVLLE